MRPQSEIRIDLAAALIDGPGTTRQLAQRTGWAVRCARTALDNMCRSGDAVKARQVRVPGCKRPVPVYDRAVRDAGLPDDDAPYQALCVAWAVPCGRGLAQGLAM